MPRKIIVIEDNPTMAERIPLRLRKEGYAVEVAHNGKDGLRLIQASGPDLVLLDLMLPGNSGTQVAQQLRSDSRTAELPFIIMTTKNKKGDVIVGLDLGADDFVTAPFSTTVLVARIAAVLRRTDSAHARSSGTITAGPINIDQERHQVEIKGNPISLTPTEFRLLSMLVAAAGRVLTRNQLIDQAIGTDAIVTDRTIDVHLTSLRRKLGGARKLLKTVRGVGYRVSLDYKEVD